MKNIKKAESKDVTVIYEKKISPLAEQAKGIKISSEKEMKVAVETLSKLNQYLDAIEEEKNTVIAPAKAIIKREKERWATLEEMHEEAVATLRKKMSVYQTEKVAIQKAEEDKIEKRIGAGKGNLKLETAVKKIEELDKPEKKISTDAGLVKFETRKKFEVMDVTLLPVEYILPNEVAIRKAMKEGIELDGVRYFTEEVPVNYR